MITKPRKQNMSISDFFTVTLGANLNNIRWSWGATNPTTNQIFLRVWDDELQTINGVKRILILSNKGPGNSKPGFSERQRHIKALRDGAEGFGVLCTADDVHASSRKITSFDSNTLLKFGGLNKEENGIYADVIGRVSTDDLARPQTSESSLVSDLRSIFARQEPTMRETLANARVGQGMFRARVLALWNSKCCVTGSETLDAVRASHIKPWRDANDDERLDPHNGLPLIATLDALFDAGLITFDQNGILLVSNRVKKEERQLLGLDNLRLTQQPSSKQAEYLRHHRESIFISAKSNP